MKNSFFICFSLLAIFNWNRSAFAQCGLDKTNWQLVYSEEFDEPDVNTMLNNGWVVGHVSNPNDPNSTSLTGVTCEGGNANMCFTQNQVSLSNGTASFGIQKKSPFFCQNQIVKYEVGLISSKYDEFPYPQYQTQQQAGAAGSGYVFGMFEIRCKLPKQTYEYPAFWLSGNAWPPEIDVFEYNGGKHNEFFSTVHWPPTPGSNNTSQSCQNFYDYSYDLTNDFHTFTVVWTPKEISWFLDGKELKTDNIASHQPLRAQINAGNYSEFFRWVKMHIIVNNSLNCPDENANLVYDPFIVDYVKVYKPNGYTPIGSTQSAQQYYNQQVSLYNNTPYKSSSDWVITEIKSVEPYVAASFMKGCQGGGKYYYAGAGLKLWSTYYSGNNGGGFRSTVVGPNPIINRSIELAKNGDIVFSTRASTYQAPAGIFYIQNNQSIYLSGSSDFSPTSNFVVTDDGLSVFYKNTNGNITKCTRTSLTTNAWSKSVSSTFNVKDNLVINKNSASEIWYRTTSDNIGHFAVNSWTNTIISNSGDVKSNIVISNGGYMGSPIIYKNNNNTISKLTATPYSTYVMGPGGYGYMELKYTWSNQPFLVRASNSNSQTALTNVQDGLCRNSDLNNLQLYYRGTDNRPWYVYSTGTDFIANTFDWNQPNIYSDFQIIQLGSTNNEVNIAYIDLNHKIRLIRYQTPCQNLNPPCGNTTTLRKRFELPEQKQTTDAADIYFSFYPNPASNLLTLESQIAISSYEIIGFDGSRQIFGSNIEANTSKIKINIEGLKAGIYQLKIAFENGNTKVAKFVKLNK